MSYYVLAAALRKFWAFVVSFGITWIDTRSEDSCSL